MAKVLNMKGEPQIEICGIPYKNYLNIINRFHTELYNSSMSHDDYLVVQTKVGWVEFHFNKQKTK